nr:unnamed protein product [Callosobruchus analis]
MVSQSIDIEKLVSKVENRSAIWDMRIKKYSHSIMRRKCCEEIVEIYVNENSISENARFVRL